MSWILHRSGEQKNNIVVPWNVEAAKLVKRLKAALTLKRLVMLVMLVMDPVLLDLCRVSLVLSVNVCNSQSSTDGKTY